VNYAVAGIHLLKWMKPHSPEEYISGQLAKKRSYCKKYKDSESTGRQNE
jgi:hypothetical protein